ncbi:MAG: biotin--[acetyl-CoA-carboxylase] ligase [Proteobacteria bacterium]|nr:biotin--[acetyl-CoA-carboxylase] ligase [Pseudomonadota bacterium]
MDWTYKNFVIHEFLELESTNKTAVELASLGKIFDRELILAKQQSAGRGRRNRDWISPAGNLYFSLVLRPKIELEKIPQLSFVAIAALRLAVKNSMVKWPNDLLIEEKKVAGLLLESKISEKNCEFVVIGIGINLTSHPSETIFPASNLENFGIKISPPEMLKKFLDEFEILYQNWLDFDFAGIRQIWLQRAYRLNEKVKLKLDGKEVEGVFSGIDGEGNLLLNREEKILKISVADVS